MHGQRSVIYSSSYSERGAVLGGIPRVMLVSGKTKGNAVTAGEPRTLTAQLHVQSCRRQPSKQNIELCTPMLVRTVITN